jgi:excisionase family DNA binding protein
MTNLVLSFDRSPACRSPEPE